MKKNILQSILEKKPLIPEDVIISPIEGDGNCFYRALSLYLTNDQSNYNIIREIIYEASKENKESLKPYFLSGLSDNILADEKLENYIEKIKNDKFYGGIILLSLAEKIFDRTIVVYSIEDEIDETGKTGSIYNSKTALKKMRKKLLAKTLLKKI